MPLKLIYTSAPRLLQAGRSGFGTVAMSRNIPFQAVKLAEECSKFSRQAGLSAERVIYSYRTVRCSDSVWHILSCVRDAGTDYSGRTNHLAQHLMFDSREASACVREGMTPAGVILGTAWPDHDGFCGWIVDGAHWDAHKPDPTSPWWGHYAGCGDCRRNLSSDAALRGAVFVYGCGLENQAAEDAKKILCLYAESQADCPDHGWGITFTTSLEPNDEPSEFRWIGVAEDSPMLPKVEAAGGRVRVAFDTPPPSPRQPESTQAPSEVRALDASQSAVLQQQNYGMPGEGEGTRPKAQGSGAKPPPLGPRTVPWPVPRAPEHVVLRVIKNYQKHLAFAVVLLFGVIAGAFLAQSFLAPTEVRFKPDSLERDFSPDQREAVVLEQPPNGEIAYSKHGSGNWSTSPPSEAGDYDLKVITPGVFGLSSKVYEFPRKLKVKPMHVTVTFGATNFVANGSNQVVLAKTIPSDAQKTVVVEYRKGETNQRGENTNTWTTNPFSQVGIYEASVRVSGNYEGVGQTGFSISSDVTNQSQDENKGVSASEGSQAEGADDKAAGKDVSPPPLSSETRFLLADKSQLLLLLPDLMPPDGDLTVERCDDISKSAKIDRETGEWSPEEKTSGLPPRLFKMEKRIPTKKTPNPKAPDVDGPLAYIVTDDKILSFVAIELVPGDNSSVMQRFFRRAHLEKKQDKALIHFNLRAGGQRVNLDQFTLQQKGERFVLEITDPPYNETTPLQLYFAPNGELVTTKERKQLETDLTSIAEEEAVAVAATTPWDQKKGELVKPLKKGASRTVPDPRADALINAIEGIAQPAQPAASVVNTNGILLVSTLVAETFKVLESDSLTSTLIRLSPDRAKKKEDSKRPGAGAESLAAIIDVSLLTAQEWQERIQLSASSSPAGWKQKAIEWIRGRDIDAQKNEGEKQDRAVVQEMLRDVQLGIEGLSDQVNVRLGQEKSSKRKERIQKKLNFLKILGSRSPLDSSGKQGRLLLVTDKSHGGVASTNILWPNVLLFGDLVQEEINNDPK